MAASLPSGSEPVSWRSRPISDDFPWSTCPTMTRRSASAACAWVRAMAGGTKDICMGVAPRTAGLHIAAGAQPLEGVLGLMVHGTPGPLLGARGLEFGDDVVHGRGVRGYRKGDADLAERAVALAVAREIQRHHGNPL